MEFGVGLGLISPKKPNFNVFSIFQCDARLCRRKRAETAQSVDHDVGLVLPEYHHLCCNSVYGRRMEEFDPDSGISDYSS